MRLDGVGIENLHGLCKVHRCHQRVDVRVPEIMTEDQESPLDAMDFGETLDQLAEVLKSVVHL